MSEVIRIIAYAISIYTMLVFFRILLSWFPHISETTLFRILAKLVDPYLNLFKGVNWLRIGRFELYPIAAIALLSLLNYMLFSISYYNVLTLGIMIFALYSIIWGFIRFFIVILVVILIIRVIGYMARVKPFSPFWQALDSIITPVMNKIVGFFVKNRIVSYLTGAFVMFLVLMLIFAAGQTIEYYLGIYQLSY